MKIKDWSLDDRPREKMLQHGASFMSNSELLAILIRSGVGDECVVDVARRILEDVGNNLNRLAEMGVMELVAKYKGIGVAKATTLVAAMELGRRRGAGLCESSPIMVIRSSYDAFSEFSPVLSDLDHEEFWVLYLSHSNKVLGKERLAVGGMSSAITDVRILFKRALDRKAHFVIVAHNHPSGLLKPSSQDIDMTEKIKQAGILIDVKLYDHLIIGAGKYLSFADEGLL